MFVTIFSCGSKQTIDKFAGTYRLDKFESFDSISDKLSAYKWRGKDAGGFIQYDGKGHMSVNIFPSDYKDFNTTKNIDSLDKESLKELARFYKPNFVYFADYKILNDSMIRHIRRSTTEPQNIGDTVFRHFEFRKDTLLLKAMWKIENKTIRLRWIKL